MCVSVCVCVFACLSLVLVHDPDALNSRGLFHRAKNSSKDKPQGAGPLRARCVLCWMCCVSCGVLLCFVVLVFVVFVVFVVCLLCF